MVFSTDCEGEALTPLAEGVWWVRLRGAEPGGVNAYLVNDRGTLTLVDAGIPWDAPRLKEGLACIGATVSDVDRVLVTHYQFERIAGFLPMQMPSREQGRGMRSGWGGASSGKLLCRSITDYSVWARNRFRCRKRFTRT